MCPNLFSVFPCFWVFLPFCGLTADIHLALVQKFLATSFPSLPLNDITPNRSDSQQPEIGGDLTQPSVIGFALVYDS